VFVTYGSVVVDCHSACCLLDCSALLDTRKTGDSKKCKNLKTILRQGYLLFMNLILICIYSLVLLQSEICKRKFDN